jgi:hypothetical protein
MLWIFVPLEGGYAVQEALLCEAFVRLRAIVRMVKVVQLQREQTLLLIAFVFSFPFLFLLL